MSLVWNYFSKLEKNIAKCKLCCKKVKTSGTTSNLFAHLKSKHLFTFNELKNQKSKVSIIFFKLENTYSIILIY